MNRASNEFCFFVKDDEIVDRFILDPYISKFYKIILVIFSLIIFMTPFIYTKTIKRPTPLKHVKIG
jgi:hypothetical protein